MEGLDLIVNYKLFGYNDHLFFDIFIDFDHNEPLYLHSLDDHFHYFVMDNISFLFFGDYSVDALDNVCCFDLGFFVLVRIIAPVDYFAHNFHLDHIGYVVLAVFDIHSVHAVLDTLVHAALVVHNVLVVLDIALADHNSHVALDIHIALAEQCVLALDLIDQLIHNKN